MGLNVNEFPPSVAYLFGKQIYDDSTHEMQYVDEILRRGWAPTQRAAFRHPYCAFIAGDARSPTSSSPFARSPTTARTSASPRSTSAPR